MVRQIVDFARFTVARRKYYLLPVTAALAFVAVIKCLDP